MTNYKRSTAAAGALWLTALLMAGGAANAQSTAQASAPAPPLVGQNVVYFRTGPGPVGAGDAMDFVGFEAGLRGKTVTDAPFTATITTQRTQVLADGNRINRTTTGTIARDSEGRVRRDMTLPAIGGWATTNQSVPHVIFISDVVSGMQYILEPHRKIAHEVPLFRPSSVRMRMRADRSGAPPPPPPGAEQRILEVQRQVSTGRMMTVSLGTRTINGVLARGTRYTQTIPAGAIGNEKPIVITTERWYSPDLHMYVLTKTSDPMRGDSVRQLTNIQMEEPDPSLFEIPPGYAVKKGAVVTIRRRVRRGPGPALRLRLQTTGPGDGPELAPPPQN